MISSALHMGFMNLGPMEMAVILVIVLIIFGPKSLPSLGRAMGRGLREFKTASSKFSEALDDADEEKDDAKPRKATPPNQLPREASLEERIEVSRPADSVTTSSRGADGESNS